MRTLLTALTLIFITGCSTTLKQFFSGDEDINQRNEKLMQEDFEVEEKVLEKFKEGEAPEAEINKDQDVKVKPIVKTKSKTRKADRPKFLAVKKKHKEKLPPKEAIKNLYPDDYPKDLIELDKTSKKYWGKHSNIIVPNEKITMDISYMGISTGRITISTLQDSMIGGKSVYHVNARIKTADFYSYLYELDDYCDSFITKDKFLPLKFSLIQRESAQDIDDLQLFDLEALKTYSLYKRVTDKKTKKSKKEEFIPHYFQDPLSIVFFIRGLPLSKKGTKYIIPIVNQGKVEILTATVKETETIETKIGKRLARKVDIFTRAKGKTISGGNMTFWFSEDDKRVFLKFQAKIKIGSISGEIVTLEN